jgi:lipopolysaccharide transport system ATP-binding protein
MLVDEVLAVGDAEFQRRCLGRMEDLSAEGRTVLFVSHNMQTISQLCDRALLLDAGRIVEDGPSGHVVASYLQSGLGSGSYVEWPDDASAPGDDLARLRWARIVDESGEELAAVDVRHPVGLQLAFRVLRDGEPVVPKIKLWDRQGEVAFNAMDTSARWYEPSPPGEYVATAWIPGHLLNEGLYSVAVGVVSLAAPKFRTHAQKKHVLSFHVQDLGDGDTARGRFTGQWQGVVRPLLEWTVEEK